ncbi:class F sortase [Actinoplanes sp. CA-030573]|uniref:class F sortase n=1 Tax=Actinoplanes sp. CA-030573 TaxID=3239898 RepID=UPI003D8FF9E1
MIRSGSRRVAGWAALTAGLGASVAGALLAIHSARPPAGIGSVPAAAAPASPGGAGPASSPPGGPGPAGPGPAGAAPAAAAPAPAAARITGTTTREPRSDDWAPPIRIVIPALHVNAPVQPVSAQSGALSIPEDPADLGWWLGSATPGSARGTVLVASHVDTATDGPGALFRLEQLPMGSTIAVRAGDHTVTYRAVARRSYDKRHLPAALFRLDTAPQLALVTCGGTFDRGTYSHNVVV